MTNAQIIRGTNNSHKFDIFRLKPRASFILRFIFLQIVPIHHMYICVMRKSYIYLAFYQMHVYKTAGTFRWEKKETEAENKVAEEIGEES